MQESLYSELIKEWLPSLVIAWENKYNGQGQAEPEYLVDALAEREYSVDGTFASAEIDNVVPMAFVMDMDSPKPFLVPDVPQYVTGEIPKIGAEMKFSEKKLTELHTLNLMRLEATGRQRDSIEDRLVSELFKPMKTLYLSQKERWDFMLKQGLSTGKTSVDPANNVGSNIVIDFGYKPENQFNASVVWGNTGYKPITDMRQMINKARKDKKRIKEFLMLQETFDQIITSDEAKALAFPFATDLSLVPLVDADVFMSVFRTNLRASIRIVENTEIAQKNGSNLPVDAWKVGTIVGITSDRPAKVVWSRLAEEIDRTECATYEVIEECILLRKYKQAYPTYGEFDSSESRSLVVVSSGNYTLDTTAVA